MDPIITFEIILVIVLFPILYYLVDKMLGESFKDSITIIALDGALNILEKNKTKHSKEEYNSAKTKLENVRESLIKESFDKQMGGQ